MVVQMRAWYTSEVSWAPEPSYPQKDGPLELFLNEVRMMRGVKGEEDTAIIVTTGRFSADAQNEARPGQNQRVVYLIDGENLVNVCKRYQIGVKKVELPGLRFWTRGYPGGACSRRLGSGGG